jgi:hypothetical protein
MSTTTRAVCAVSMVMGIGAASMVIRSELVEGIEFGSSCGEDKPG